MKKILNKIKLVKQILSTQKEITEIALRLLKAKHFIIHTCDDNLKVTTDMNCPEIMVHNFLPKHLHDQYKQEIFPSTTRPERRAIEKLRKV